MKNHPRFDRFEHTGIVDQDIHPAMLLQSEVKGLLNRLVVLDVHLQWSYHCGAVGKFGP